MTTEEPGDPLEAGTRIADVLERRGIPYALGGALAYGVWAVPRATIDVDVNVFVREERLAEVLDALASLGVASTLDEARKASVEDGLIVLRYGSYRLDVFTPSIDFSWEAARTRVCREIDGKNLWFLSAEALAVFKLLFFRGKDLVDLERLVAVQGERLDSAYVRRHLVEMMGEEDERVRRWDAIVERARSG